MSNTPDELRDLSPFIREAKGNILINGLGLGVALELAFQKKEVKHIRVIENSLEVIELTGNYYKNKYGNCLDIIQDNALEYPPKKGEKCDVVWHDIWNGFCSDNLKDMTKLHRKYCRRTKWQDFWGKQECLRLLRQEKKQRWF